ncbi:MAG: hypothetical protein ACXVXW_09820 [Mycobacteriaceae bacterium]
MAGFDDLIPAAMPYLATERIPATANTSWQWDYTLLDDSGALVNVSSGFTFSAIITTVGGATVCTPTITSPSTGILRCVVPPSTTASIAPGMYLHEVKITRTSDSAKVLVVGAGDAKFVVKKAVS